MRKCTIRYLKKCPSCMTTNIYRRVRIIHIEKNKRRKENKNFEEKIRHYRCNKCKHEFDSPIVEQVGYI